MSHLQLLMLSSTKPEHTWTTRREKLPTGPETPGLALLTTAAAHDKSLLPDVPGRKGRKIDPGKSGNKGAPRAVSPSTLRSQLPASVFWRSVPVQISETVASSVPDLLPPSQGQIKINTVNTIGVMVI